MSPRKRTICLDLGNTLYKAALFEEGTLHEQYILHKDDIDSLVNLIENTLPDTSILASVTDHPVEWEKLLMSRSVFHKVSHSSLLNFKVEINKPETIGTDRLALVAGAIAEKAGTNVLIISLGTCITYNFIHQGGAFLGGAISPGMEMRFRALHEHTSGLPEVKLNPDRINWAIPLLGYDTPTAIQSGVVNGMIAELEGVIMRYQTRYEGLEIILTGGLSPYFAGLLKNRIFADTNLLFKGLYALSQLNCK
jgi:type III pantothenate kinase